jgi:hypothetical protein
MLHLIIKYLVPFVFGLIGLYLGIFITEVLNKELLESINLILFFVTIVYVINFFK